MAAALTLAALTVYLPAAWASGPVLMAGQQWLIKDNDLAVIGGIGSYQWIGCGLTTAPLTPRNYTPCHPGQDRIYASWWRFRDAVRDGRQPAGSTAIFDNETWAYTPKIEQADQRKYERLAGRLARARGITLVMTPYAPTQAAMIADDVTAGRYASVVEIQSQSLIGARARPLLDDVPAFAAFVAADVAAIRKASPTVPILAGLATDAGGDPGNGRPDVRRLPGHPRQRGRVLAERRHMGAPAWPGLRAGGLPAGGCGVPGRPGRDRTGRPAVTGVLSGPRRAGGALERRQEVGAAGSQSVCQVRQLPR
jgi:hypothetical protein